MMPQTGRCLCGEIRFTIDAEPLAVVLCHCDDCQRESGGAFSVNVVVPRSALNVDGTPKKYRKARADNGNDRDRHFCASCGSPLFTMPSEQPDVAVIKAGTLDDSAALQPTMEIWHANAQPWLGADAPRRVFDGGLGSS